MDCLDNKEKALVYRNYFDRYTQLTAMLTGFQSFVMTVDTVEEVHYLPMLLVSISFLGNMFVCFVSIISYNVLTSGVYLDIFKSMNAVCVGVLAVSNACYFMSIMWSSHITFVQSGLAAYLYLQISLYVSAITLGVMVVVYYFTCECRKQYVSCPSRQQIINAM